MSKITAIPGFFGETNYYDSTTGEKVGESLPGLFGETNYYDLNGNCTATAIEDIFGCPEISIFD